MEKIKRFEEIFGNQYRWCKKWVAESALLFNKNPNIDEKTIASRSEEYDTNLNLSHDDTIHKTNLTLQKSI